METASRWWIQGSSRNEPVCGNSYFGTHDRPTCFFIKLIHMCIKTMRLVYSRKKVIEASTKMIKMQQWKSHSSKEGIGRRGRRVWACMDEWMIMTRERHYTKLHGRHMHKIQCKAATRRRKSNKQWMYVWVCVCVYAKWNAHAHVCAQPIFGTYHYLPLFQKRDHFSLFVHVWIWISWLLFLSLSLAPPIYQTRYASILLFHLTRPHRDHGSCRASVLSDHFFLNHPPLPYAAAVSLYKSPPNYHIASLSLSFSLSLIPFIPLIPYLINKHFPKRQILPSARLFRVLITCVLVSLYLLSCIISFIVTSSSSLLFQALKKRYGRRPWFLKSR